MIAISDTLEGEGLGSSRLERYWKTQGFRDLYKAFRKGKVDSVLLKKIADVRNVEKVFKLRGFQFGNWVTNEDRFNYLAALGICLADLNKVLKFKNNSVGLDGALGIAFGARGTGAALAHYEPRTNIINITRYKGGRHAVIPKSIRFANTGGVGAFAHEYGHFLDFYFGSKLELDKSVFALTNGSSTNRRMIPYNKRTQPIRILVEELLKAAYWHPTKKEASKYIQRIESFSSRSYYVERTEIFARLFEQYIGYKLKALKIQNSFLAQTKYHSHIYMTQAELKKVVPIFDKILVLMRQAF